MKNDEPVDADNQINTYSEITPVDELNYEEIKQKILNIQETHARELDALKAHNRRLIAIIGHEIRSPVSSLLGFLMLVKDGIACSPRPSMEQYVDIAMLSAKKTFILLDDMLEWALAERNIGNLHQEEQDIKALLLEELERIELFASEKQITIRLNVISDDLVCIDVNMIRTVIRNLLTNAVKYSHRHGNIVIKTERVKSSLEISITDNGIGMKQEIQDLLFSERGYNSRLGTANEPGTGFGLLLCKEFIEAHKGKIWISSEVGKGSKISFTLPLEFF